MPEQEHLLVVAAPRRSLSRTDQPALHSPDDLLALVRFTTSIASALETR
jgi:hypothetical protein